jgi:hypothetical protein
LPQNLLGPEMNLSSTSSPSFNPATHASGRRIETSANYCRR